MTTAYEPQGGGGASEPLNYAFLPPDPPPAPPPRSPPPTRFRFKSKPSPSSKRSRDTNDEDRSDTHSHKRRRHHQRERRDRRDRKAEHRSKRHHHSDDSKEPRAGTHSNLEAESGLDADAAFRASLFDALADDEGAAFWEGVYGQPIHTYSNARGEAGRREAGHHDDEKDEDGDAANDKSDVHRMAEDEYVAFVRAKMWERTHEHVVEERARRARAAEKQAEDKRAREREREAWKGSAKGYARWTREVEEGLARGERRKEEKKIRERWNAYLGSWEDIRKATTTQNPDMGLPWPVITGRMQDVHVKGEVERFLTRGASIDDAVKGDLRALLKQERVRWHPDKMQQRLGSLDTKKLEAVTAVFQIVGRMWEDGLRQKT